MSARVDGWIDVHAHFYAPGTPESDGVRYDALTTETGAWILGEPSRWTAAATLDFMDRAGMAMQLPSNVPKTLDELRESDNYGASVVASHPSRFGPLAAVPTDDIDAALAEIDRCERDLQPDGYSLTCN
jgi:6-methylsalicylate decarboxylase